MTAKIWTVISQDVRIPFKKKKERNEDFSLEQTRDDVSPRVENKNSFFSIDEIETEDFEKILKNSFLRTLLFSISFNSTPSPWRNLVLAINVFQDIY